MKGLLLKDIYNLKKQILLYMALIAFYGFIATTSRTSSFLIGLIPILSSMFPMSAMTYDERSKWDRYALSMPVTRDEMVLSRYILGIGFSVVGLAISLLISLAMHTPLKEALPLVLGMLGIALLFLSFIMPLLFKFGVENGRLMMFLCFLIPFVIVAFGSRLLVSVKGEGISNHEDLLRILIVAIPVVVVLLLIFSIWLSCRIYQRKEF